MGKGDLFMAAMQAKGGKPPFGGGSEEPEAVEPASEGGDTSVSPDEKLAAYEVMEALKGSGPAGAAGLAKALKAFFLLVDAQPHTEGGTGDEEGGESPFPGPG